MHTSSNRRPASQLQWAAWERKWQSAPHYKHTKHFYSGPDKNRAKKILNISRSHLTRLISIITGFNCLSYIQFKANPAINPLCRLCGEDNETFWHFITDCPRLQTYRNDTFLDKLPQQDNWKLSQLRQFSTCLLYTSPSPRDATLSRMPSSA